MGLKILQLRGPLADDPTARILHALLLGLLSWAALYDVAFIPYLGPRLATRVALSGWIAVASVAALVLLHRGARRAASLTCLGGLWVASTLAIVLNGGIRSPGLVLYMAIPISAAWLLGYRAALMTVCLCLATSLAMAVSEALGIPPIRHLPGTPFGVWAVVLLAMVIAAVPAAVVLRVLNESLAATQRWIRELHQSEAELRRERDLVSRLMEMNPVGIIAVNAAGGIYFANSEAEQIFGINRDELVQRSYNDSAWQAARHEGGSFPDEEHPFRQVQATGRPVRDVRVGIVRGDGRRVLLSINAAPVTTPAGQFDGMVASLEDITERARAQEELRRDREHLEELVGQRTKELVMARDQAVAANRAKSVFLANMSHELRTPLNAILGFSSLVRQDPGLSEEHCRDIDIINRSGEHLLQLINDVLDVAKIEAGRRDLEVAPCDLGSLVREVSEMIRVRAEAKKLNLLVIESAGFPRYVWADARKVRQVLINLLANAVQYTDSGSITLRLSAKHSDGRGQQGLRLDVEDMGIGIAKEDQERIFDAFTQVGKVSERKGTGLGLAITKQFVELMGGSISVDSRPGKGSRFCVALPLRPAQASEVAGPAIGEPVIRQEPGQPEYRILIVEDEGANRILLTRLLENAGLRVRVAADGAQGVEMFRTWQPHFIWMDLRMPVMNGLEATQQIRAMAGGRDVKIAALTASASAGESEAVRAAGLDDFLCKPYRPIEVFECMARHLGLRFMTSAARPASQEQTAVAVAPENLAGLPDDMREQLRSAVIALDVKRISGVIRQIAQHNPAVGATLAACANRFAYTAILSALESRQRCQ